MKEHYFFSQPHQPFFVLGVVNAIVMMLFFGLSYDGSIVLESSILSFHTFSLIFLTFSNLFLGFLFTTFPRFCQSEVIAKEYYSNIFFLNIFGTIFYLLGALVSHFILVSAMVMLFVSQILSVLKLREIFYGGHSIEKSDAFWILNGFYFSLVGMLLYIFYELNHYMALNIDTLPLAINISFYMFLIFVAFSVGQRMIPFFSHSFAQKNQSFVKIVFVAFILKSIMSSFEINILELMIDIFLAIYLLKEFLRWKLPVFNSPAILYVLHIALFWLPLAFGFSAMGLAADMFLDISTYYLNFHLLAIGFLTTLLIGFGTRVTLGHSGQSPNADKFTINLFWFIQIVVFVRALFSFNIGFSWDISYLFEISFSLWIMLFLIWSYKYIRTLIYGTKL